MVEPTDTEPPQRQRFVGYVGSSLFFSRSDDVEGTPSEGSRWVLARLSLGAEMRAGVAFFRAGGSMRLAGRAYGEASHNRLGYGVEGAVGVDVRSMRAALRVGVETNRLSTVGLRFYPVSHAYVGVDLFHIARPESADPQLPSTNVSLGAGVEDRPRVWSVIVVALALAGSIAAAGAEAAWF